MDFKAARKALKQGHPVTVRTANAAYPVERLGARYAYLATGDRIPLTDILAITRGEPASNHHRLTQGPGYLVVEIHQPHCGWCKATHQQVLDLIACEIARRGIKTRRLWWVGDRLTIDRDGRGEQVFNFPARFPSSKALARALDRIADHYKAIDQSRAQLAANPTLM